MAVAEYDRRLEEHRQKMAFGHELLAIVESGSTLQEFQSISEAAAKIAEKIEKVKNTSRDMKQAVIERKREVEQEIRSDFTKVIGQDRDPDMDVIKDEIQRVNQEVAEKEKNCAKLIREKEHLQHDMKYHKVLKGIAPVHFDKSSTDAHVKGFITKSNGELQVFEFNLEEEDKCSVADFLWNNL